MDNSISARLRIGDGAEVSSASSRVGFFDFDGDAVTVDEVEYADLLTSIRGGVEVDGNSSAWENTGTVTLSAIGKTTTSSEIDWDEAVESLNDDLITSLNFRLDEPRRVCRRPFGLSYAAMACCSSAA